MKCGRKSKALSNLSSKKEENKLNLLESLYEEAENSGVAVENFCMPSVVAVAATIDGRSYIGIDRSRLETSYAEAECIAHELGHLETSALYSEGETKRKRAENKASEWAICRIVPYESFVSAYNNGCREVWEFAEELNISCDFASKVMQYYKKNI